MDTCRSVAFASKDTPKPPRAAKKSDSGSLEKLADATLPMCAAVARGAARCAARLPNPTDWCIVQAAAAEGKAKLAATEALRRPAFRPPAAPQSAKDTRREENAAVQPPRVSRDGAPKAETICVRLLVSHAIGLPKADMFGTADPYVELRLVRCDPLASESGIKPEELRKTKSKALESKTVFRFKTQVVRGDLCPKWEETYTIEIPFDDSVGGLFLYFRIYDYDLVGSDDFLGHLSVGLMDALATSTVLSAGWRALLRGCPKASDRIDILRDERLKMLPPPGRQILAAPGQEKTYDLSGAEFFFSAAVPVEAYRRKTAASTSASQPLSSADQTGVDELNAELARSVQEGNVAEVRRAIAAGGAVNSRSRGGKFDDCTALHIACLEGFGDIAMALVDVFNASLVARAPGGRSPAMCACEAPNETLAEWLIVEGVPVDLRDDAGRTVLFYAARAALPQFVSWLIGKQHLPANERGHNGTTPLSSVCGSRAPSAIVVAQQLLEAHANANVADTAGKTPLHVACEAGDDKCARLLLSTGKADAYAVDAAGRTPIDFARAAQLPESTLRRLALPDDGLGQATDAEKQRPGETAEDAAKRQSRARRAAAAQDNEWLAWRTMHPRRAPGAPAGVWDDADAFGGSASSLRPPAAGKRSASVPPAAADSWEQPWVGSAAVVETPAMRTILARSSVGLPMPGGLGFRLDGTIDGVEGNVPLFVGLAASSTAQHGQQPPKKGRISRLKAWALSLRGRSDRRSLSGPPKARGGSPHEWDLDMDPPAADLSPRVWDDDFI